MAGATKERGECGERERRGAQWATVAKDKRLVQLLSFILLKCALSLFQVEYLRSFIVKFTAN